MVESSWKVRESSRFNFSLSIFPINDETHALCGNRRNVLSRASSSPFMFVLKRSFRLSRVLISRVLENFSFRGYVTSIIPASLCLQLLIWMSLMKEKTTIKRFRLFSKERRKRLARQQFSDSNDFVCNIWLVLHLTDKWKVSFLIDWWQAMR